MYVNELAPEGETPPSPRGDTGDVGRGEPPADFDRTAGLRSARTASATL
jgi:hypothetical protein